MFPCRTDPASRTLAVAQGQEGLPAESVEYEGKCYGLDTLQPKLHGRRGRNHTARRNPDTKTPAARVWGLSHHSTTRLNILSSISLFCKVQPALDRASAVRLPLPPCSAAATSSPACSAADLPRCPRLYREAALRLVLTNIEQFNSRSVMVREKRLNSVQDLPVISHWVIV